MAGPVASKIILPDDSGNSGKQVRTQTRDVGVGTVHEHFYVPALEYTVVSRGHFSSAQQTIQASAHNGTSTGFYWLWNPVSSTVTGSIKNIIADANAGSALATPTAPVISFSKFTATGTLSGATVSAVKAQSAGTALQLLVATAMTGLTITLVGAVGLFSIPSAETAVGCFYAQKQVLPELHSFQRGHEIELAPGEGLAVWQSTNGTSSDTRKFTFSLSWVELDVS